MTRTSRRPQSVASAIRSHVGALEVVLRASGMSADEVRALPKAEALRMQREFDACIEACATWFSARGLKGKDVEVLARRARRADDGTAFLKAVSTNAASSMVVNLVVLAITIALSFVLPAVPLIAASLVLSLALAWRYGMHAWAAGAAMGKRLDRSHNARGCERSRFGHCVTPSTVRAAAYQEAVSEGARTGTRLLAAAPLQIASLLSSLLNLGAGTLAIFSATLGPLAAIAGPVSNGLQELASRTLSKHQQRHTSAPLFGISVTDARTIGFNASQVSENCTRLQNTEAHRALKTVTRMIRIFGRHFSAEVRREQERGLDGPKFKELLLGGLGTTPALTDLAGAAATASGAIGPFVKFGAAATIPVVAGGLHVAKRAPVSEAWANAEKLRRPNPERSTTAQPSDCAATDRLPTPPLRPRTAAPAADKAWMHIR